MNKYCNHVANVKSHVFQKLKFYNLIGREKYWASAQTSNTL